MLILTLTVSGQNNEPLTIISDCCGFVPIQIHVYEYVSSGLKLQATSVATNKWLRGRISRWLLVVSVKNNLSADTLSFRHVKHS